MSEEPAELLKQERESLLVWLDDLAQRESQLIQVKSRIAWIEGWLEGRTMSALSGNDVTS